MLFNLEMQYQNGIRISFTDLNSPGDMLNPGPFVSYTLTGFVCKVFILCKLGLDFSGRFELQAMPGFASADLGFTA